MASLCGEIQMTVRRFSMHQVMSTFSHTFYKLLYMSAVKLCIQLKFIKSEHWMANSSYLDRQLVILCFMLSCICVWVGLRVEQ